MKSDSLADKAYGELRKKILSNQLLPGKRLKEEFWAKKMKMSRISIREALNRLVGEKLLVFGERGGFFVKSITADNVGAIRELRQVLEVGALRLILSKLNKQKIQKLQGICDDFTTMVQRGYLGGACEADIKFHEALIDCADNDRLKEIYQISNIPLFHLKLGQTHSYMEDYELTDSEHRKIVNALYEKDLLMAEETLIKHLHRGEVTVLDTESEVVSNSFSKGKQPQ